MTGANEIVGSRAIARARLLLGGVLLFAAVLTWGVGSTLDPSGKAVVAGTGYVRSTVVTFKRNGAIGTLILSAISAWLLFPMWRVKQPIRNWALAALLVLLSGSSIYTLLSLRPSASALPKFDENLATSYDDLNATGLPGDESPRTMNNMLPPGPVQFPNRGGTSSVAEQPVEQAVPIESIQSVDVVHRRVQPTNTSDLDALDPSEPTNTASEGNRD